MERWAAQDKGSPRQVAQATQMTSRGPAIEASSFMVCAWMKDLGIAEYHIAEVVGHENNNITSGRYGKRANLAALRDVVAKLQLPI